MRKVAVSAETTADQRERTHQFVEILDRRGQRLDQNRSLRGQVPATPALSPIGADGRDRSQAMITSSILTFVELW